MNKCKYCTHSQGEYDPIKMIAVLLCNHKSEMVEPNDSCNEFQRETGADDQ